MRHGYRKVGIIELTLEIGYHKSLEISMLTYVGYNL